MNEREMKKENADTRDKNGEGWGVGSCNMIKLRQRKNI